MTNVLNNVVVEMENTTIELAEETKQSKQIIALSEFSEGTFELLEVSNDTMSVSQFMERLRVFLFNDPMQRNMVWTLDKKSELIVSILEDVSIGEIKTEKIRKSKKLFRNVLDGKQRLTSIRDFMLNKYALVEGSLVEMVDEFEGDSILVDISGAKFDDLPEMFKNKIKSLMLDIKGYENLTPEKKATLFRRWNSGEALTPSQLRKAKLSLDILVSLAALKDKPVFKAGFTESSLKKEANQDMLLKAMMVIDSNNSTGLSSALIDNYIQTLTVEKVVEFAKLIPYAESVFNNIENESVKKKGFGVAKTISFMWVIKHAFEQQIATTSVAKWVEQFTSELNELGYSVKSSTTLKDKVVERNNIALNHFNNFHI